MVSRRVFQDQQPNQSLEVFSRDLEVNRKKQLRKLNKVVKKFVTFLEQQFSSYPRTAAKVFKAGSLGKGTAVRHMTDIDLVVFFNGLKNVYDLVEHRESLLDQIEEVIKGNNEWTGKIRKEKRTQFSVQYVLNDRYKIDILPAFAFHANDAKKNKKEMYDHMKKVAETKGQKFVAIQFSASLAPIQVEFFDGVNQSVKKVIRLVKKLMKENDVNDLPSYAVELVTIHTAGDAKKHHKTEELFTRTLDALAHVGTMSVYFKKHYDVNETPEKASDPNGLWEHEVPYVIDVANPYNNVLQRVYTRKTTSEVAQDAFVKMGGVV